MNQSLKCNSMYFYDVSFAITENVINWFKLLIY